VGHDTAGLADSSSLSPFQVTKPRTIKYLFGEIVSQGVPVLVFFLPCLSLNQWASFFHNSKEMH